jgi:uncharacterized protein with NAD-binding domain and iron-sulfur cluster
VAEQKPIQVAIVGGGCASISAAFELTRPEHQGKYAVTIYQLGWRLGGKGASGRGPADRIEEHGIHLWMGFYENAFRLMRECYAELARDRASCPIADWRDAFVPVPLIGVTDVGPDGAWRVWKAVLPPNEGNPGDPFEDGERWSVVDYMRRSVELVANLVRTIPMQDPAGVGEPASSAEPTASSPTGVANAISRLLQYGELASLGGLIQGLELLKLVLGSVGVYPENLVRGLLDGIAANARELLEKRLEREVPVGWVWQVIDLTLATLRGAVRFGLMTDPRGFDAIDEYDCREWLLVNGASEKSVDSGYLRALYDLVFAYEDGQPTRPKHSAGVALRCMVRSFFTYRGAFFWRMMGGMGDVVVAPFYEVLQRRGVRFEFFHRLENVTLADPGDGDTPHVAALEFDVQALVRGGVEYQPLIDVRGLPGWPSKPDYGQLVDGEKLEAEGRDFESHWDRRKVRTRILRQGEDFDLVVLGVGIGAIPHVCRDILARDPRWRAMVDHVKTVATQAFQLWMAVDMKELGWSNPPIVVSGFVEPFDSWGDMRPLIPLESWPRPPRALAYFCNALPDTDAPSDRSRHEYPSLRREEVRRNAIRFLNDQIVHLWPEATRAPGEFRWEVLVEPDGPTEGRSPPEGESRFASQFWTANVNPSDRYSLSLPGSSAYRISPLDRAYDNLTIAGDWTDCGLNAGCVEAAVMSGRLAAHAIAQSPALKDIIGFDHP